MSGAMRPPGLADHLILLRNRLLEHERLATEAALQRPTPDVPPICNRCFQPVYVSHAAGCPPPESSR